MRVRIPRLEGRCHQCCTSPSETGGLRRAADVPARRRVWQRQRHHILQLVTKTVSAAQLVKRRARPHAACECLVKKPAIQHQIHALVRSRNLHGAESFIPLRFHTGQQLVMLAADNGAVSRESVRGSRSVREKTRHRRARQPGVRSWFATRRRDQASAPVLPESGPPRSSAAGLSAVPLRPRNSVRSPV